MKTFKIVFEIIIPRMFTIFRTTGIEIIKAENYMKAYEWSEKEVNRLNEKNSRSSAVSIKDVILLDENKKYVPKKEYNKET